MTDTTEPRERTYTAELPQHLSAEVIEALMGLGAVRYTFEGEFASREEAVRVLSAEYGWRGLDEAFWDAKLSGRRERASEKPWKDPLDRQPGDVLLDRNSLRLEWRVLEVARRPGERGRWSAQYKVEPVEGGPARWKPSDAFSQN